MGFYTFCIGKGVFIPLEFLFKKYEKILKEKFPDTEWEDIIEDCYPSLEVLQEYFTTIDERLELVLVGHDALENDRGSDYRPGFPAFDDTKYYDALEKINKMKNGKDDRLVFIGVCKELQGGEMNYRGSLPEFLYSLPVYLPDLVKTFSKYKKEKLEILNQTFDQKPLIWTFAPDCACCT